MLLLNFPLERNGNVWQLLVMEEVLKNIDIVYYQEHVRDLSLQDYRVYLSNRKDMARTLLLASCQFICSLFIILQGEIAMHVQLEAPRFQELIYRNGNHATKLPGWLSIPYRINLHYGNYDLPSADQFSELSIFAR